MRTLLFLSAVALAAAQEMGQCDPYANCVFQTVYKGNQFTFDIRGLCNEQQDYVLTDGNMHTYYAQICGYAQKQCNPKEYSSEYQFGRVIQTWGSVPPCDNSCPDKYTGQYTCCTESCEVPAANNPTFSLYQPGDASQGFVLTYVGATPTNDDPYQCDFDPVTFLPQPRMTHMQFFCDHQQTGFANFYDVEQNTTNKCDYILKFKTSAACVDVPVSGGWIFNMIILVGSSVYIAGAFAYGYYRTKKCVFPHTAFWSEFFELVYEGVVFTAHRCRKPQGGFKRVGTNDSAPIAKPMFSNSSAPPLRDPDAEHGQGNGNSSSDSNGISSNAYSTFGGSSGSATGTRPYQDI